MLSQLLTLPRESLTQYYMSIIVIFFFFFFSEIRHEFITNKYIHRRFIDASVGGDALVSELSESIDSRDIKQLLQV